MALDDRDYMRERSRRTFDTAKKGADRPFTPPAEGTSLLTIVACWICVGFVLYKLYGWWDQARHPRPPARPPVTQRAYEPQQESSRVQPDRIAAPSFTPSAPALTPSPSPLPSVESPRTEPVPSSGTIYHCKDYGGGTFWAQAHCSKHNALIDRMASVPSGMPFQQQVEIAEQQRQEAARILQAAAQPVFSGAADPAPNRKAQCDALEAQIQAVDAQARQPLPGQEQDRLAALRKQLRDQQFRIRC
jgi:hypothetical protein